MFRIWMRNHGRMNECFMVDEFISFSRLDFIIENDNTAKIVGIKNFYLLKTCLYRQYMSLYHVIYPFVSALFVDEPVIANFLIFHRAFLLTQITEFNNADVVKKLFFNTLAYILERQDIVFERIFLLISD